MQTNNPDNLYVHKNTFSQYIRYKYQIFLEVNEAVRESSDEVIEDTLLSLETNEYYYHLEYNQKIMINFFYFNDFKYLDEYLVWRYRTYIFRGLDTDFIILENRLIKNIVATFLTTAHSLEISKIYDYLEANHKNYIDKAEKVKSKLHTTIAKTLYELVLKNDEQGFRTQIKDKVTTLHHFCDFFTHTISPVIRHIGKEWETNVITVAQEHIASAVIKKVVLEFLQTYKSQSKKNEKVFITAAPNEEHNLGIEMAINILEILGYDVVNIGSKNSTKEISNAVYHLQPDYIILTATLPTNLYEVAMVIKELQEQTSVIKELKYYVAGNAMESLSNPHEALKCDYYFRDFLDFYEKFLWV